MPLTPRQRKHYAERKYYVQKYSIRGNKDTVQKIVKKYKKLKLNKQNFVVTDNTDPLFGTAQITPSKQYLEDNREDTSNYAYPNSERHAVMLIDFITKTCYFVQTKYFSLKGKTEPEELLNEKLRYVLLNCIHLFHIKKVHNIVLFLLIIQTRQFILIPNTTETCYLCIFLHPMF